MHSMPDLYNIDIIQLPIHPPAPVTIIGLLNYLFLLKNHLVKSPNSILPPFIF